MHVRIHDIIFLKKHFDHNAIQMQKNIDCLNDESAVMGSRVVVWDNLPKTLYVRKHISLNASNRHSQKILCYLFVFFITKSSRNQYLMSYCFSSLTLKDLLPCLFDYWDLHYCLLYFDWFFSDNKDILRTK